MILALEDTQALSKGEYLYTSTLCLELVHGELVYVILNAEAKNSDYERFV